MEGGEVIVLRSVLQRSRSSRRASSPAFAPVCAPASPLRCAWVDMLARLALAGALLARAALAYIPAVAVNDTGALQHSDDIIQLVWQPSGVFRCGASTSELG